MRKKKAMTSRRLRLVSVSSNSSGWFSTEAVGATIPIDFLPLRPTSGLNCRPFVDHLAQAVSDFPLPLVCTRTSSLSCHDLHLPHIRNQSPAAPRVRLRPRKSSTSWSALHLAGSPPRSRVRPRIDLRYHSALRLSSWGIPDIAKCTDNWSYIHAEKWKVFSMRNSDAP